MNPLSSAVHSHKSDLVLAHLPPRRRKEGLVYAEGERTALQAIEGAWTCRLLFIDNDFAQSDGAAPILEAARRSRLRVVRATPKALQKLSDCETAPPVGVLVEAPRYTFTELSDPPPRLLVLDRLKDPGNAGTLIRTAVAFGFSVTLTEGSVSLANDKVVRSSAGICFLAKAAIPGGNAESLPAFLAEKDYQVFGFSPDASSRIDEAELDTRRPVAIIMGSEVAGLDHEAWREATSLRIPIARRVESLNVAVSGAIALYEFARRLGG